MTTVKKLKTVKLKQLKEWVLSQFWSGMYSTKSKKIPPVKASTVYTKYPIVRQWWFGLLKVWMDVVNVIYFENHCYQWKSYKSFLSIRESYRVTGGDTNHYTNRDWFWGYVRMVAEYRQLFVSKWSPNLVELYLIKPVHLNSADRTKNGGSWSWMVWMILPIAAV